MANLRIVPLNFFDDATLTATSEVAGMEIENAQVSARDAFWRSTSLVQQVVTGTWGGDGKMISAFAFFRHNAHGGTVRLQLYSDTALAAQVYDSGTVNVHDMVALGSFDWGVDPLGTTSTDPLVFESPYYLYFTAVAAAGFKITLDGDGGAGDSFWEVGRFWLGKYFEVGTNPNYGAELGWMQISERKRTRGGSLRSNASGRWRQFTFDLKQISTADRPTWLDMMAQAGLANDIVVSLFPVAGGRVERDYTVDGKFVSLDPIGYGLPWHSKRVTIEEV
jgi:hypothetical protein